MWGPTLAVLCLIGANGISASRLQVSGTHFVKNGHKVFLNGVNQAWVNYGHDFGNHQYSGVRGKYVQTLSQLHSSGGNSIRVWLHIEGESSPHFDHNGYVDKTDASGSLISDMRTFLHDAQHSGVLVFFVLWNGAKKQSPHYRLDGLIRDTRKLQTYIDHALVPMVNALKSEPALGGWEIINEPEGELKTGLHNSNPCFDSTKLSGSGAGWEGQLYTPQELQRFINWQADAIRRADPGAMVTVGSWNSKSNTDRFGYHNLWKDSCLTHAGGKSAHHFNDYGIHKPLVIGEFRQQDGGSMTIQNMYNYAYYYGYSGAWGWQANANNWATLKHGIAWLKGRNDQAKGGMVNFGL